jgi:hypothetical protein
MRNVAGDALADEPFYRELRRRHHDVDIVVLAGREPEPTPPLDLEAARRDAAQARQVFDEIWQALIGEPVTSSSSWRPGTVDGVVHRETTARHDVDESAHRQLLDRADGLLTARGWSVQSHRDGVPRVLAGHDDMTVRLTWWDGTTTLTMQGAGTSVGVPALRQLLAEEDA